MFTNLERQIITHEEMLEVLPSYKVSRERGWGDMFIEQKIREKRLARQHDWLAIPKRLYLHDPRWPWFEPLIVIAFS